MNNKLIVLLADEIEDKLLHIIDDGEIATEASIKIAIGVLYTLTEMQLLKEIKNEMH